MGDTRRMVSCISGNENHLFHVNAGSEADKVCTGQHISMQQCPDCIEDHKQRLRKEAEMCECQFIADAPLCQDGCAYVKDLNDVEEAPEGLVGYIPD